MSDKYAEMLPQNERHDDQQNEQPLPSERHDAPNVPDEYDWCDDDRCKRLNASVLRELVESDVLTEPPAGLCDLGTHAGTPLVFYVEERPDAQAKEQLARLGAPVIWIEQRPTDDGPGVPPLGSPWVYPHDLPALIRALQLMLAWFRLDGTAGELPPDLSATFEENDGTHYVLDGATWRSLPAA